MAQTNTNFWTWANPFTKRDINPDAMKKDLRNYIAPVQLQRYRQDILTWRDVLNEAENVWFPHRVKAQRLFIDTINNEHVASCMERRKDLTLLRKWEFVKPNGDIDEATNDIFMNTIAGQSENKEWFGKFLEYSMDALFFGYSLIALNDIISNEFPNIDIVKRWNVSPDRENVTNFIYSLSGAQFMEEPYRDWHVYVKTYNEIGTSPAGYGLLYKAALPEIYLRNIKGYNADFIELFAQPFRVGKTTKTTEPERAELAAAIQQMGSSGWALIDPEDEITFLETALGGTGYKGYESFQDRCEKGISKLILGHADAMSSTPGKLGSSGEKNPSDLALIDKQTKDGVFIQGIVNKELIPRMRNLGFNIPLDTVGRMKNDSEQMEFQNIIIDQALKMQQAGLPMDGAYFTEKTGIPVGQVATPQPTFEPKASIKNKLEKIYGKHEHGNGCKH